MSQESDGGRRVSVVTETAPDRRYARVVAEAASLETVDRVKQGYEFWNCGEPDLMLDLYAEDCELDLVAFLYPWRSADNKIVRSQLFPSVQAAMDFATASAATSS